MQLKQEGRSQFEQHGALDTILLVAKGIVEQPQVEDK
jgi:hypothetical protein